MRDPLGGRAWREGALGPGGAAGPSRVLPQLQGLASVSEWRESLTGPGRGERALRPHLAEAGLGSGQPTARCPSCVGPLGARDVAAGPHRAQ